MLMGAGSCVASLSPCAALIAQRWSSATRLCVAAWSVQTDSRLRRLAVARARFSCRRLKLLWSSSVNSGHASADCGVWFTPAVCVYAAAVRACRLLHAEQLSQQLCPIAAHRRHVSGKHRFSFSGSEQLIMKQVEAHLAWDKNRPAVAMVTTTGRNITVDGDLSTGA